MIGDEAIVKATTPSTMKKKAEKGQGRSAPGFAG
jgi:hypothetical protein